MDALQPRSPISLPLKLPECGARLPPAPPAALSSLVSDPPRLHNSTNPARRVRVVRPPEAASAGKKDVSARPEELRLTSRGQAREGIEAAAAAATPRDSAGDAITTKVEEGDGGTRATSVAATNMWRYFSKGERMQRTNKFLANCNFCSDYDGTLTKVRGEKRMMASHLRSCDHAAEDAKVEASRIAEELKIRRAAAPLVKFQNQKQQQLQQPSLLQNQPYLQQLSHLPTPLFQHFPGGAQTNPQGLSGLANGVCGVTQEDAQRQAELSHAANAVRAQVQAEDDAFARSQAAETARAVLAARVRAAAQAQLDAQARAAYSCIRFPSFRGIGSDAPEAGEKAPRLGYHPSFSHLQALQVSMVMQDQLQAQLCTQLQTYDPSGIGDQSSLENALLDRPTDHSNSQPESILDDADVSLIYDDDEGSDAVEYELPKCKRRRSVRNRQSPNGSLSGGFSSTMRVASVDIEEARDVGSSANDSPRGSQDSGSRERLNGSPIRRSSSDTPSSERSRDMQRSLNDRAQGVDSKAASRDPMQDGEPSEASSGVVVTNDGVRLFYESKGTGPAVILIHGWSGSSKYFLRNFSALAESFRVICFDLRGHGDSCKPDHGFHVARLAVDLLNVLDHFRLDRAALLGCSLGCSIIWSFVEMFGTSRLSATVFVDQSPFQLYSPDGTWKLGSNGLYSAASVAYLTAMLKSEAKECHIGTVQACLSREATAEEKAFFVGESMKADGVFLGKLMSDHNNIDWRATLPLVTCPSLVIAGKTSKIFPVDGVAYSAESMPNAELLVFDSGHWLYYEEPERFNSTVIGFLERIFSRT